MKKCGRRKAMKKKFQFSLDEKPVEELRAWAKTKGMSLSGYINVMIHENVEALKVVGDVKDFEDLKVGQVMRLMTELQKGFQEAKDDEDK